MIRQAPARATRPKTFRQEGGVRLGPTGADFALRSVHAEKLELCLFNGTGDHEIARLPMLRGEDAVHRLHVDGVKPGTRYGYRAHGPYDPDRGHWFDPAKLLVDPYATELDRPFVHDPRLGRFGEETADLVPRAIVTKSEPARVLMPLLEPTGFVYEVAVKPFTRLHPEVPEAERGTVAALAHPAVIAHLKRIGVDAIELMPITAWIDERHLPPLGLTNSWGYNPIALMALDPRLVPGGMAELRYTVDTLHSNGIGVILDLVFNHSGESDRYGTTLSMRGLDNRTYYRHHDDGTLVNDTGCGNTIACDEPYVRGLIVDSLRHFVLHGGVDGFRFDLAPILGRTREGFSTASETLAAIVSDDVLEDRILIAEPWDIGPGGYQLGNFPAPFLEWNDRARDDMRRYWRGDSRTVGALATALAGSSNVFGRNGASSTRSVNFIAAHDGFSLMDIVSYNHKHNERNGEDNRDGHNENFSWNSGIEGQTADRTVLKQRLCDASALLATLFVSRGTVMLTAGDEWGRSQQGNNNAYCQDNEITWLDWSDRNEDLLAWVETVAAFRKRYAVFAERDFFKGDGDVVWLNAAGEPMTVGDWEADDHRLFGMLLKSVDTLTGASVRLAILFNRGFTPEAFALPATPGAKWRRYGSERASGPISLKPRSVGLFVES